MATDRQRELTEALVQRWVMRRLGATDHEGRVLRIATTLFSLTAHLHALGPAERKLLRLACLLHDVGRSVDSKSHASVGAEMIHRERSLPLLPAARRMLCYLTEYHRGPVPGEQARWLLRGDDDDLAARRVLALLRSADALDSRSLDPPRLVFTRSGRKIRACCYLTRDCLRARQIFTRRKKHRLLEELLSVRLEVDVKVAEVVHAVA